MEKIFFLQVLREELEKNNLLPKRYDWEGQQYDQTFDQLVCKEVKINVLIMKILLKRKSFSVKTIPTRWTRSSFSNMSTNMPDIR